MFKHDLILPGERRAGGVGGYDVRGAAALPVAGPVATGRGTASRSRGGVGARPRLAALHPAAGGYAVAVVATIAAVVIRMWLTPLLRDSGMFLFQVLAVTVSAWYGGMGPGLLATVLGAATTDYFLLEPVGQFASTLPEVAHIAVFVVVGLQVSWLSSALLGAKRRAEADAGAARQGEQLYRTLAQNFPKGAVFLMDRRWRVVLAAGDALPALNGACRPVPGVRLRKFFPRELADALSPLLRVAGGGSPVTREIAFDGRVYLVHLLPLDREAAPDFAGIGIAEDVTELAGARETLRAGHAQLETRVAERTAELAFQKTLLEAQSNASPDGILVVSDEGRIVFFNRRLPELWELPPDVFSGPLEAAVHAMRGRLTDGRNPLESAPTGGGGGGGGGAGPELPPSLFLDDGRTFESYSAPVGGAGGRTYGTVWYFRDVTERRRLARRILEAGECERQRIGQDLHDDLCQQLAGIACLARVLQRRLESRLPEQAPDASRVVDLVEQAIRRSRDLARGLQPLQLGAGGLAAALEELAADVHAVFQVPCAFECPAPVELPDAAAAIHLYRIAQEATNNAVRHGKPARVRIGLSREDDRVRLTVADDGAGIPQAPVPGLGLRTMQHRARVIGATLTVEPAGPSGGTVVSCTLAARAVAAPALTEEPRE